MYFTYSQAAEPFGDSACFPPRYFQRFLTMPATTVRISNVQALRNYVYEYLCAHNQLEVGAFQMTEQILIRQGQPCGMLYCLYGPRSLKLTAVWETDRNTILFYGSAGERHQHVQLVGPPALANVSNSREPQPQAA
jgi:hypothetical protein